MMCRASCSATRLTTPRTTCIEPDVRVVQAPGAWWCRSLSPRRSDRCNATCAQLVLKCNGEKVRPLRRIANQQLSQQRPRRKLVRQTLQRRRGVDLASLAGYNPAVARWRSRDRALTLSQPSAVPLSGENFATAQRRCHTGAPACAVTRDRLRLESQPRLLGSPKCMAVHRYLWRQGVPAARVLRSWLR